MFCLHNERLSVIGSIWCLWNQSNRSPTFSSYMYFCRGMIAQYLDLWKWILLNTPYVLGLTAEWPRNPGVVGFWAYSFGKGNCWNVIYFHAHFLMTLHVSVDNCQWLSLYYVQGQYSWSLTIFFSNQHEIFNFKTSLHFASIFLSDYWISEKKIERVLNGYTQMSKNHDIYTPCFYFLKYSNEYGNCQLNCWVQCFILYEIYERLSFQQLVILYDFWHRQWRIFELQRPFRCILCRTLWTIPEIRIQTAPSL